MSPAVPTDLSGAAVAEALERGGFEHISTRGSHAKYRSGERTVIVPLHRSLAPGTLRSILRQADWTVGTLEERLK
ncbi:type II toxin-antitoxin system HicA family toxin [Streptomyces desertarenae]|uniref:Type II toxin-antitoxin system HicA family toxin n=1 Tax=Streptomyces desertarenae TaxID=2666184 RepID=A0ABW4PJL2_9ACTN